MTQKIKDENITAGTITDSKLAADVKQNFSATGNEGLKVPVGTTAQRGSTQGQVRYNTDLKSLEVYNGSSFDVIYPTPTITAITPTTVSSDDTVTFTITGTNFRAGMVVSFITDGGSSTNADTTAISSSSTITATKAGSHFTNANEPYDVRITSLEGQTVTSLNAIDKDIAPTFSTAAGNVGTIDDVGDATHATIAATDPDSTAVTFAEVNGSNLSGAGLAINSSTGAITGEPNNVGTSTTVSFDVGATSNSVTTTRTFNIIINPATDGS